MNSTTQLEFHPDAESLNAFAEKALPEREREQMVAHLAVCSRCRQVIFLARQAASEMEMAAAPAAYSAGRSGSWLSGWRLAWIPAVALASVVGLAFLVHGRQVQPGSEMARAVPQSVPQAEGSATEPAAKERDFSEKAHAPVSHVLEQQPEIKVQSAPAGAAYVPAPAETVPPPASVSESVTVAAAPPGMTPGASAGQAVGMNEYKPVPVPEARLPHNMGAIYSSNATANYDATKAKMDEMTERDQANRKGGGRYAGSGGASNSRLKKNVMPNSSYDAGAQITKNQFVAAREGKFVPLPSGLEIVSRVTTQNLTLAIDEAGALFLSRDSGSHWESVARQWTGRAVDVSVLPSSNGRSFVAAPINGAAATPAAQPEVFELRNDKNQTWVSTDGVIWTAQ
jgi:hypothetical protein